MIKYDINVSIQEEAKCNSETNEEIEIMVIGYLFERQINLLSKKRIYITSDAKKISNELEDILYEGLGEGLITPCTESALRIIESLMKYYIREKLASGEMSFTKNNTGAFIIEDEYYDEIKKQGTRLYESSREMIIIATTGRYSKK